MMNRSKLLYFNLSLCPIDNLVYRLYNLTYDEIKIVEGQGGVLWKA
jgi:hypothetical protein